MFTLETGRTPARILHLLSALCLTLFSPCILCAAPPQWWYEREVVDQTQTSHDYTAVNQGQLKNIAKQAVAEMDAHLPGGAGDAVHALVNSWVNPMAQTNDYAAVNLGQLKAVAKPFYDQLILVGYTSAYPWTGSSTPANDYAAANIGQVKNLFAFDLLAVTPANDTNNDGLPDWWEMYYFGTLNINPNALAPNGMGLTILQSFQQGLNPKNFYVGQTPSVTVVSGNGQMVAPGSFVPYPLVVQVLDANGNPISGAPVMFALVSGDGQLQATRQASPKTTVSVLTDANGHAQVFFQVSSVAGTTSSITAIPTGTNPPNPQTFQETADPNGATNSTPTDPNNPPTPQPVPVQSYAALDVSGDAVLPEYPLIALDDNNVVSFETSAGYNGPFSTYVWQNGTLGAPQTTPGTIDTSSPVSNAPPSPTSLSPYFILPTGDLIGICGSNSFGSGTFDSVEGIATPSYFPTYPDSLDPGVSVMPELNFLTVCSENGVFAGSADTFVPIPGTSYADDVYFFFISVSGSYIAFDPTPTNELSWVDSGMTVVSDPLAFSDILSVNNSGHAIGPCAAYTDWNTVYWNGAATAYVGLGYPRALNEQDQIVVAGLGGLGNEAEGYLWENGTTTILANHLPAELQGQIQQIEPVSISNQTAPGTDATIYILANAYVNSVYATIVCTRDNDGDWSFAQVGVPDGTTVSQYASINCHGAIAGIGSVSNGAGTNVTPRTNATTPSPSPQSALVLQPDVTFTVKCSTSKQNWIEGVKPGTTGSTSYLYSQQILVTAKAAKPVQGPPVKVFIVQDFNGAIQVGYDDGSFTYCGTNNFLADDVPPSALGHPKVTTDTQGNSICTLSDAPSLAIGIRQRHHISYALYNANVRDFVTKQVGNAAPTVVAELDWSFYALATFSPDPQDPTGNASPIIDLPLTILMTPKADTTNTWDGSPPTNLMVTPRTPTANSFINNTANYVPSGSSGNEAHQYINPSN